MVLMNAGKMARNAASIVNKQNCGGPKKAGLMGYIGGVGIGGISTSQRKKFCGNSGTCTRELNTVFRTVCEGNYTNPSQSAVRRVHQSHGVPFRSAA
jgi:hypothetical protein